MSINDGVHDESGTKDQDVLYLGLEPLFFKCKFCFFMRQSVIHEGGVVSAFAIWCHVTFLYACLWVCCSYCVQAQQLSNKTCSGTSAALMRELQIHQAYTRLILYLLLAPDSHSYLEHKTVSPVVQMIIVIPQSTQALFQYYILQNVFVNCDILAAQSWFWCPSHATIFW